MKTEQLTLKMPLKSITNETDVSISQCVLNKLY